jgi:hypothetical protein
MLSYNRYRTFKFGTSFRDGFVVGAVPILLLDSTIFDVYAKSIKFIDVSALLCYH